MAEWATEWSVEVGNMEVLRTENEQEAQSCFDEYCGFNETDTVTLLKNGQLDDQRDGFTPDEEESEEEGEEEGE